MNRPDPATKTKALIAAEALREAGDTDGMAHYLMYLHERNQNLEAVYEAVQHFLRSGTWPRYQNFISNFDVIKVINIKTAVIS